MTHLEINEFYLEEIISILAQHGRPDLIAELRDPDYEPPKSVRKEALSDTEGSAEEESDYEVEVDSEGFLSLK
jgi:hypothetical protein